MIVYKYIMSQVRMYRVLDRNRHEWSLKDMNIAAYRISFDVFGEFL